MRKIISCATVTCFVILAVVGYRFYFNKNEHSVVQKLMPPPTETTMVVNEKKEGDNQTKRKLWFESRHKAAPGVPFLATESPVTDDPDWGTLRGYVNNFSVHGNSLNDPKVKQAIIEEQAKGGEVTWMYIMMLEGNVNMLACVISYATTLAVSYATTLAGNYHTFKT